jgi:hypothetical protein
MFEIDKVVVSDQLGYSLIRPVSSRPALETAIGCGFDASRCMLHLTFAIVRSLVPFPEKLRRGKATRRQGERKPRGRRMGAVTADR